LAIIQNRCIKCKIRGSNRYEECIECFGEFLIPIYSVENYCPKCLQPYDGYNQCGYCYKCIQNDEYWLDGIISISYEYGQNSDFGYAVHAYKGSGIPKNEAMRYPLKALTEVFLTKHIQCILSKYGSLDGIVPIAGRNGKDHVEKLLPENSYVNLPVVHCLVDTYTSPGQSSRGEKTKFDPDRYSLSESAPKRVLLFDDVTTKLATANSAAYTLKNAGNAKKVILFTLAKHLDLKNMPEEVYEYDIDQCIICTE
jgi:predicted amidophosphoribosyltransferase